MHENLCEVCAGGGGGMNLKKKNYAEVNDESSERTDSI